MSKVNWFYQALGKVNIFKNTLIIHWNKKGLLPIATSYR